MNITNNIVAAYIDSMYRSGNANLQNLREMAEQDHVPVILRDTESLLKVIMKIKKPAKVLEIGTAVGYSSCVFAECSSCMVTTIEADENIADVAESNIKRLGFGDRIQVLRGEGRDVLKKMNLSLKKDDEEKFDLIFIDAAKSHYREFWDLSMPALAKDGIVICDNVLQKGMTASDEFDTKGRYRTSIRKMREFLEYINSLENFETCIIPVGDGVSISINLDKDRNEND